MSHHSRSSSEVETTSLREILPVFFKDFNKDFSFSDVKELVKDILGEENLRRILDESNERKQNLQLFWVLYENETCINRFLNAILMWYPWLGRMVLEECNSPSKDTEKYIHTVGILRSNFQKYLDCNIHRIEYYWRIRSALKKLKPYNYVVVSGELGVGKKWLVVDVLSEYSVMNAMNYNIFWLNMHDCNSREDDFRALQQFNLLINEGNATATTSECDGVENKILSLQQNIRRCLKDEQFKDCLLVLCDVPNSKAWKNFNLGCKLLIITRNRCIAESFSKSTTTHIAIDRGLTSSECFQLFEKVLKCDRTEFPTDASDIFSQSDGHPYLLSIIANNLKQNNLKRNQRNWVEWKQNLQNLQIKSNKFKIVVELSLNVLNSHELNLYKTLAVFPHSIKIPLKLLAAFWNKTEQDTGHVLAKFDKYSIINLGNLPDESVACILPFIYSSYLKDEQNINQSSLHKKVVNYYGIPEVLNNRCEVDPFSFTNDYYFHHCIGYHLRESGYLDIFPKLFLDFGFLGQKLRFDGFPNTIGDLKYFEEEITGNDFYKTNLVSGLLEFLPSIEEMLFRSKDTCLLQYALMADGIIKEEAVKQASLFHDRIWFNEKGHFHQRRQMVCLPNKPKQICLPEPDTCVIALDNNEILLADLSLDYNNGAVYLTDNQYPIYTMELILQDNYILSLDVKGNLKVWSIADDRRRSASRKRSSRTKVNPLNLTQSQEMLKRKCKQHIQKNDRGAIQTFHVEKLNGVDIDLHLAFENGDICVYSWEAQQEKFQIKNVPTLRINTNTTTSKIIYLSKILAKYYLILTYSGKLCFYNLRDGSNTGYSFNWQQSPNLVYIGEYIRDFKTHIIFVYRDKVLCLTLPVQKFEFLDGSLECLYSISDNNSGNAIVCARLSSDGYYLVLGTKRGLIVYSTKQKSEVLRGNISLCITCVDIYPMDDKVFKYIIVCGAENSKVLNLFALRQVENNTIAWTHRLHSIANDDKPQFEPDVWLQGNTLFDLNYSDSVLLVAADSKNRIHQLCTTDTKNWSISLPPETSKKITAITSYHQNSFCGYDNGELFNITREVFEESFTTESITFLQLINENILVASSKQSKQSIVRRINDRENVMQKIFNISVFKCFMLSDSYLILLDPEGGYIVVDLGNEFNSLYDVRNSPNLLRNHPARLGGCDLKNNYLVLATVDFDVFIYKCSIGEKLQINYYTKYSNSNNQTKYSNEFDEVTCITSSSDSSLFAVGLKSGTIEIYQMDQKSVRFIFRLLSHTFPIYDLKFSPNTEILVSCSEQLCFWHVSYILNNPFDTGTKQKRRSSRFTSSHSPVEEVTNAIAELNHSGNGETYMLANPWSNKRGPIDKPELLACIKFAGNKAEKFYANDDFTQFNTIDNEGVYYHLCVHEISRRAYSYITNGNGHLIDADGEDDVIT